MPAPAPAPEPSPVTAPAGWSILAVEGQAFSVTGVQTVRYGSGTGWIVKDVPSGAGTCSTAFFGSDPLYGAVKHCELSSTPPAAPIAPVVTEGPATGTPSPILDSAPQIVIDPSVVLHPATSHLIGVNRNHIAGQNWSFPNASAKMQAMLQLTPTWAEKKMLYRIGHGPTDGRLDTGPGYEGFHFADHFGSASSYPYDAAGYPYDDLRNALAETATMNADQIHVVNFGTSDPTEAGRYVSYLNRAGDSNRAAHPFAQQNAKLFEVGNEISWDQVRGHAQFAPDEVTYARRAVLFSQSMRANSDQPIMVGAVLSANLSLTGNGWSAPGQSARNILSVMGTNVDFLTYHGYAGWPMAIEVGSQPAGMSIEDTLTTYFAQIEYHRGLLVNEVLPAIRAYNATSSRDVFLANTEFLTSYQDPATARGMWGALYSAAQTVEAMNFDIRTSVNFCFSHGEAADSLMFLNDDPAQVTAVFRFLRLLARHWGDQVIQSSGKNLPVKLMSNNGQSVNLSNLQFSAAQSNDRSRVFVMVANVLNADVQSSLTLPFTPSSVKAFELSGSQGMTSDSTQVQETSISGPSLSNYLFKKASITIFEISR